MAKLLALAYPLAVFTLFLPQPNANPSPKQQKQPKTPISKGEGGYYLQEIQTQKKNHHS
jgi:hypothetical protein